MKLAYMIEPGNLTMTVTMLKWQETRYCSIQKQDTQQYLPITEVLEASRHG